MAQQEGEALLRRVPEIDLVMGPQYANRLGDLLEGVFNGNQIVATAPTHIMEDPTQPRRNSDTCAWVNVIYGCNERCTFCVVPTTRGAEQSRPIAAIQAEVTELVAAAARSPSYHPFGSAPARPLHRLRARLAARAGSALPGKRPGHWAPSHGPRCSR